MENVLGKMILRYRLDILGCLHDVNIDRDGIDRGCVSSFTLEMQVMLHNEIKQKFPCKKVSNFTPLVRRFLKSGEFNQDFAGVLNTEISVGVERVVAVFSTTTFPFLDKVSQNSKSSLHDIARLEPHKAVPSRKTSSSTISLRANTQGQHSTLSFETFGHTSTLEHLKKKKSVEPSPPKHPKDKTGLDASAKLTWAKLNKRSRDADFSKDNSGPESPLEFRRSCLGDEDNALEEPAELDLNLPLRRRHVDSQPMEEEFQGAATRDHDLQAKMKATPRKLAYADYNKEAPVGSLAKGFSDLFSLESSGTSDTHRHTRSTIKS
ncbi:hypothetical protein Tco_1273480 [Tanacetum coccineum]